MDGISKKYLTHFQMGVGVGWVAVLKSSESGGRLNIKMSSYQYRDSHVKDKTVSPTVLSLTWESPYLGKTVFILRRAPGAQFATAIFDWVKKWQQA